MYCRAALGTQATCMRKGEGVVGEEGEERRGEKWKI